MVPSGPFVRKANVSPNEMALNYRLGLMGLDRMRPWTEMVDDYVSSLRATPVWQSLVAESETLQ
jgi:hypothetical protein